MADNCMTKIPETLKLALSNPYISFADMQKIYNEWEPEEYEKYMLHWSPDRHKMAIQEIEEVSQGNKNVHILDAGAGTGLVGQELFNLGYVNIDALEPNHGLQNLSIKKNVYKKMYSEPLGLNKLSIDDKSYDIVISVGVFGQGHADEKCFDELIRITKKGGYVIIITAEYYFIELEGMETFEPAIEKYEKDDYWKASHKVLEGYSKWLVPGNGVVYKMQIT